MNRRRFLCLTSAAVVGLAGPAHADFVDQVRQQLADQGYRQISITTTLLGRSQLIARGKKGRREIVMNPRTGEILRDVWIAANGSSGPSIGGSEHDDDKGRGKSNDDDDARDEDDDDDRDDDNSGNDDDAGNNDKGGSDDDGGDDD